MNGALTALVSKAPALLAAASAIAYFACSAGIRNHLLALLQAAHAVLEHVR
jgi:hypothetical protein